MICQGDKGGVCDCGDPEAWVQDFVCDSAVEDDRYKSFKERDVLPDLQTSFLYIFGVLRDYIIDVMSQSDSVFIPPRVSTINHDEDVTKYTLDPTNGYPFTEDTFNHDRPSEKYSLIYY